MKRVLLFGSTHFVALLVGFAAGIYVLPILTAPPGPDSSEIVMAEDDALFTTTFRRDLEDSDGLHWGEGTVLLGRDAIALDGEISPGPDFKLYLSPVFVETEADFLRLKSTMTQVGDVKTFENFIVPVATTIDLDSYNTVIVWCESFDQFITAAQYR